jgi:exosortase/archaeosortase family protein
MVESSASFGRLLQARSLVLYLSIFSIIYFSFTRLGSEVLTDLLISFTISLVVLFSKLIGLAATSEGDLLTISGFTLSIDSSCTAISLYSIFIAGVVAYPGYDAKYKLKGLFYGVTFLIFFNIVRVIAISLVGAHFSRSVFDFMHVYVFQLSFVVFVCLAWIVWLKRDIFKSRQSAAFIGLVFIGTLGCILVMWMTIKWYVGALSYVASSLNSIINQNLDISRYNDEIAFGHSGKLTGFRIYQHVFDSAIFFGLMLASAKGSALSVFLRRVTIGALILIVMHLIIIFLAGNLLSVFDTAYSMDWVIRSISIVVPILLWLKLKKGLTNEHTGEKRDEEVVTAS